MKKLMLALFLACCMAGMAQTPKGTTKHLVKSGDSIKVAVPKVKKPDSVIKIVDGIKIYKGAKGGLYYYRTSKAGNTYKCYIK